MNILCINTATSFTSVNLLRAEGTESNFQVSALSESSWLSANDEAEKLMPTIREMLMKQNLQFDDLHKVLVVNGPGSFTGLRIGVSVANTIAYLTQAELCYISTFDFWHNITELPILVFAGKGGVYLSVDSQSQGRLINLPEINEELEKLNIKEYFGDITAAQKEAIDAQFQEQEYELSEVFTTILAKHLNSPETSQVLKATKSATGIQIVKPLYIKKPAITQSKKKICFT